MGKELEYKLQITENTDVDGLLADPIFQGAWEVKTMKTTYFDSPDRRFSRAFWTLRHRIEGENSVVCVKTPTDDVHTRGEWQISAPKLDEKAIEGLILQGAPLQLAVLYGLGDVYPLCGAEFVRRSIMLTLQDGSRVEFAYDRGILHGRTQKEALHEVELELYEGEPAAMLALVKRLQDSFALVELPYSKFARSSQLE